MAICRIKKNGSPVHEAPATAGSEEGFFFFLNGEEGLFRYLQGICLKYFGSPECYF